MKTNNRVLALISTSTVLAVALVANAATPKTKTVAKPVAPKTAVVAKTTGTTAPSTKTPVVATIHKGRSARLVRHTVTISKTAKAATKAPVKG